jgi:hypothetical protein
VLACFHVVVKMYRYSLEERVFIVKTYWITGSIKSCQRFVERFGGRNPPSKRCIQLLVKKLETKGTWRGETRNVTCEWDALYHDESVIRKVKS